MNNIVKGIILIFLDGLTMVGSYFAVVFLLSSSAVTLPENFMYYIRFLIPVKMLIYLLFGLYFSRRRAVFLEICGIILANCSSYLLFRYIFNIDISIYFYMFIILFDLAFSLVIRSIVRNKNTFEEDYRDYGEEENKNYRNTNVRHDYIDEIVSANNEDTSVYDEILKGGREYQEKEDIKEEEVNQEEETVLQSNPVVNKEDTSLEESLSMEESDSGYMDLETFESNDDSLNFANDFSFKEEEEEVELDYILEGMSKENILGEDISLENIATEEKDDFIDKDALLYDFEIKEYEKEEKELLKKRKELEEDKKRFDEQRIAYKKYLDDVKAIKNQNNNPVNYNENNNSGYNGGYNNVQGMNPQNHYPQGQQPFGGGVNPIVKEYQQELLDSILYDVKNLYISLNDRSKIVKEQEFALMLKLHEIKEKEEEFNLSNKSSRTFSNLSDDELLDLTDRLVKRKKGGARGNNNAAQNQFSQSIPPIQREYLQNHYDTVSSYNPQNEYQVGTNQSVPPYNPNYPQGAQNVNFPQGYNINNNIPQNTPNENEEIMSFEDFIIHSKGQLFNEEPTLDVKTENTLKDDFIEKDKELELILKEHESKSIVSVENTTNDFFASPEEDEKTSVDNFIMPKINSSKDNKDIIDINPLEEVKPEILKEETLLDEIITQEIEISNDLDINENESISQEISNTSKFSLLGKKGKAKGRKVSENSKVDEEKEDTHLTKIFNNSIKVHGNVTMPKINNMKYDRLISPKVDITEGDLRKISNLIEEI